MKKFLKDFLIVSRANIQIASLPTASIGVALAAGSWQEILHLPVLLYIILFFTILTYSCHINCLNDLEVDEKHKNYLSQAVQSVGIHKLKILMAAEIALASLIIISLCILKKEILYLSAFLGILCGYIYSAPPFRIKKRGIFSPIPVLFGLYFLPIIAGWFIIANSLSSFIILFGIGYALIMQGITFINTCEDYDEDINSGIRTLAHVLGIRKTLLLASALVFTGGILDSILILLREINLKNIRVVPFILVSILIIFFFYSIITISEDLYLTSKSKNPFASSKKEANKMPQWFLKTRYPLFFISLLLM